MGAAVEGTLHHVAHVAFHAQPLKIARRVKPGQHAQRPAAFGFIALQRVKFQQGVFGAAFRQRDRRM
ncbi:hypothetical protein AK51_18625 [Serratia nematodiphila DZ0503SBS1]|nr:hypothetical protein AK51_18625 [Serratia nematodiphila DZ0503SBS1]